LKETGEKTFALTMTREGPLRREGAQPRSLVLCANVTLNRKEDVATCALLSLRECASYVRRTPSRQNKYFYGLRYAKPHALVTLHVVGENSSSAHVDRQSRRDILNKPIVGVLETKCGALSIGVSTDLFSFCWRQNFLRIASA